MSAVTIKSLTPSPHEPFLDDEGIWVHVVKEHPDGTVEFSDGMIVQPMPRERKRSPKPRPWKLTKNCSSCGEDLPRDLFHVDRRSSDGMHSHCKTCRSVAKAPSKERYLEPDVWFAEAEKVLGRKAILPNKVEDARTALLTTYPIFIDDNESQLQRKLKARNWKNVAEETVMTIDVFHDVTVKFKNIASERLKTNGAKAWLAGDRDNISSAVQQKVVELFERRIGAKYRKDLPSVITEYQGKNIQKYELVASGLIGGRFMSDSDVFSYIVDNRE